ncbi:MAG: hypothetical protein KGJ41_10160 [Rhodospirillales bacterium]|nr:hypothetical protein [Rhodospirillales bacterium]MDE2199375.1 hypothetical protein [Rhodospirillales bacterium]MDE2576685.1 hypothetical protein [Rhodospirillales bacterium]
MRAGEYVPHIDLLLQALRINRERLSSKSKIAIDARLLRALLAGLAAAQPFSEAFYLETYPDIAEAFAAGQIDDLQRHFVDHGFFEGRLGAAPQVDEEYYVSAYEDVAGAVRRGDVASGMEHYLRSGAAEGRVPNARLKPEIEAWVAVLRADAPRA